MVGWIVLIQNELYFNLPILFRLVYFNHLLYTFLSKPLVEAIFYQHIYFTNNLHRRNSKSVHINSQLTDNFLPTRIMEPVDVLKLLEKVGAAAMMNLPEVLVPGVESILELLSDESFLGDYFASANAKVFNIYAVQRGLFELSEQYFRTRSVKGINTGKKILAK